MSDPQQFIDETVKSNDVVLFMKGTKQFPMCGFSGQLVQILDYVGVPYKDVNVLEGDGLRDAIKQYTELADHPAALCEGRVCRRLRHRPRDVPGRRTAGVPQQQGLRRQAGQLSHHLSREVGREPGPLFSIDELFADGLRDGLGAGAALQLTCARRDMMLDGSLGNPENLANLPIRLASAAPVQRLELARR